MVSKKTDFPYGDLYTKSPPKETGRFKNYEGIDFRLEGINSEICTDLEISNFEIRKFYIDIAELILPNYAKIWHLKNKQSFFTPKTTTPFIIGIAGSVAVGKSTFSKILQRLLSIIYRIQNVELITTDGFLYPNSELEKKGLMERKGFPESYYAEQLYDFFVKI